MNTAHSDAYPVGEFESIKSVVERASLHKEAVAEWSLGDQAFRTGRGSAEAHWQRGNDLWMQAKGVTKIEA